MTMSPEGGPGAALAVAGASRAAVMTRLRARKQDLDARI